MEQGRNSSRGGNLTYLVLEVSRGGQHRVVAESYSELLKKFSYRVIIFSNV